MPDIFVYLLKKGQFYSFLRIRNPGSQPDQFAYKDYSMKVEKAQSPKGLFMDSGFVNLRFALGSDQELSSLRSRQPAEAELTEARTNGYVIESWAQEPVPPAGKTQPITLVADVYMGKELICCDEDGLSDPIIFLDHHGAMEKTSVFNKSLNPIWCERRLIQTVILPGGWIPPVVAKVYDVDESLLSTEYEPIGLAKILVKPENIRRGANLEQVLREMPNFSWHEFYDETGTVTAKIFMSMTVAALDSSNMIPALVPPLTFLQDRYNFKIHILGLRGLQSAGVFPVRQPMIKFHVGALKNGVKSKGGNPLDVLTARCKKGGPDPSFSELIT